MNELYPLKFKPIFKEKIWGGNKIAGILKQKYAPLSNCGELWAISGIEDESSIVTNGFLKGNALNELVEVYMGDLVGDRIFEKYGNEFPLLFKFISTNDFLSIQVHPGDELAMKRHQSAGKTEMWYIIDADGDSQLISGFNKQLTRNEYLAHLQNKTLKEILNFEKVQLGDVFYIPSGHVHAIGKGILLAEIQQSSDITYRIYDWDRRDLSGMKRELHTELALDAMNFNKNEQAKMQPVLAKNRPVLLQKSEYFTVNMLNLDSKIELDFIDVDSFVAYMCIEGAFNLKYSDNIIKINCGEALLVPADIKEFEIIPENSCKLLETFAG